MKAIAQELGLDPLLVERAARLTPVDQGETLFERFLGGRVWHRREAHLEVGLTDDRTHHLLSLVKAAVEQQGEGEANSAGMSWHSVGEGSQLFVTAHTEGKGTRVRVTVDRRGAIVGGAVFTIIGAFTPFFAALVIGETIGFPSPVVGWGFVLIGVSSVLAFARSLWISTSRATRTKVDNLMDTVSRSLSG